MIEAYINEINPPPLLKQRCLEASFQMERQYFRAAINYWRECADEGRLSEYYRKATQYIIKTIKKEARYE